MAQQSSLGVVLNLISSLEEAQLHIMLMQCRTKSDIHNMNDKGRITSFKRRICDFHHVLCPSLLNLQGISPTKGHLPS